MGSQRQSSDCFFKIEETEVAASSGSLGNQWWSQGETWGFPILAQ